MSEAENPNLLAPDREVTPEDIRSLAGASTPHFALQLRNRIRALIRDLPAGHPARIAGEREIVRLDQIAFDGEVRGHPLTRYQYTAWAHNLLILDGADSDPSLFLAGGLAREPPRPQITTSLTIQNGAMFLGPLKLGPTPRIPW